MSGRPRTTSFAEGSKSVRKTFENQPPKPPLGGVKISMDVITAVINKCRSRYRTSQSNGHTRSRNTSSANVPTSSCFLKVTFAVLPR
ncbi:unnamed protein product [Leptidea sinapis]|uniref:Uncharacterized protein n=1 Tax=Leptidea sinapis TaxID=189913 RepID=A0A5E4QGX8_9NEOP|nr:unnamed protein product [Leptidea sinapis]